MAAPHRPYAQRAAALRVTSERRDGARLLCALRMMDDPDPRLRARAAPAANRAWWNTDHRSREEAEEMLGLLERHRNAFTESTRSTIRSHLLRAAPPGASGRQ